EKDELRSHGDGVTAVAFTPDSKALLLACDNGVLRSWDVASGQENHRQKNFARQIQHLAPSPDGMRLATALVRQPDASPEGRRPGRLTQLNPSWPTRPPSWL